MFNISYFLTYMKTAFAVKFFYHNWYRNMFELCNLHSKLGVFFLNMDSEEKLGKTKPHIFRQKKKQKQKTKPKKLLPSFTVEIKNLTILQNLVYFCLQHKHYFQWKWFKTQIIGKTEILKTKVVERNKDSSFHSPATLWIVSVSERKSWKKKEQFTAFWENVG